MEVQRDPVLVEYTSEEDISDMNKNSHVSPAGKSGHNAGTCSEEDAPFGDQDGTRRDTEKTPAMHRLRTKLMKGEAKRRWADSPFSSPGQGSLADGFIITQGSLG